MRHFWINTYAFAYRNAIFAKRNVFVVVEMLFWPIMSVLTTGLMGGFLRLDENTLAFVLTGAIAAGILQVTQLDVGYSLMYDVWSKSVKHTFLAPFSLPSAFLGAWLVGIARGTVVFVVLAGLSKIFFHFILPPFGAALMFLFGTFWMSLLVGSFIWILILLYGQRAEIAVWAMTYLVMVLCGIYYPVDLLPGPFYWMARLVPLTYFMDAVRTHYGFPSLFQHALLQGLGLSFVYTLIGVACTQKAVRHARQSGILVRLSE